MTTYIHPVIGNIVFLHFHTGHYLSLLRNAGQLVISWLYFHNGTRPIPNLIGFSCKVRHKVLLTISSLRAVKDRVFFIKESKSPVLCKYAHETARNCTDYYCTIKALEISRSAKLKADDGLYETCLRYAYLVYLFVQIYFIYMYALTE